MKNNKKRIVSMLLVCAIMMQAVAFAAETQVDEVTDAEDTQETLITDTEEVAVDGIQEPLDADTAEVVVDDVEEIDESQEAESEGNDTESSTTNVGTELNSEDEVQDIEVEDSGVLNLEEIDVEKALSENAKSFAESFDNSIEVTNTDVTPILSTDSELVGCSIALYDGATPCGYINYDFTRADYITDFIIEEDVPSMYDQIVDMANAEDAEDILYQTDGLNYAIETAENNETVYYDTAEGEMDPENFEELNTASTESSDDEIEIEVDVDEADGTAGGENAVDSYIPYLDGTEIKVSSIDLAKGKYSSFGDIIYGYSQSGFSCGKRTFMKKYDKSLSLTSERLMLLKTKKYACAVAALTGIIAQEGLLYNGKKTSTFNKLWTTTGTTAIKGKESATYPDPETGEKLTVTFGSTKRTKFGTGMRKYASQYTNKTCKATYNWSPSYTYFKNSVDKNISTTFSGTIRLKNSDTTVGHAVNVVGYCSATYGGKTSKYLIIGDGWNSNAARYINFNASYVNKAGVRYRFS